MRYHALATDYDGTLAHHGRVDDADRRRAGAAAGHRAAADHGHRPRAARAARYLPADRPVRVGRRRERRAALPPGDEGGEAAGRAAAGAVRAERCKRARRRRRSRSAASIVATWEPHETAVLETIRELGLELQVIFNKGAVMVLPAGVNKATGLTAALKELGLSPHNVVGVGDAENDHAFLQLCECVGRGRQRAAGGQGDGRLRDRAATTAPASRADRRAWSADDLGDRRPPARAAPPAARRTADDGEVSLAAVRPQRADRPAPSASGKSTLTTGMLERLAEQRLPVLHDRPRGRLRRRSRARSCSADPQSRAGASRRCSTCSRTRDERRRSTCSGMPIADRPPFFLALAAAAAARCAAGTGRPHWLVLDEAHHLLPAEWQPPGGAAARGAAQRAC